MATVSQIHVAGQSLVKIAMGLGFALLAWSILVQVAVQRLPGSIAQGIAPNSPTVLERLAQERLLESRFGAAERLARSALVRQPFNTKALRTLGLALDESGDRALADKFLTLAGNWTLRDTATHIWLFNHRIRAGEYGSAFAHLDTVLRRREDLRPQFFEMMQRGAVQDAASVPAIADRLARKPNWRAPFFIHLGTTAPGQAVAASLAVSLKEAGQGLDAAELEALLKALLASRNLGLFDALATRLSLGGRMGGLVDGDFEGAPGTLPFGWEIGGGAGAAAEIVADEDAGSKVLRVEYDGFAAALLARQLTRLRPGPQRLSGRTQVDGDPTQFRWSVSCIESGLKLPVQSAAGALAARDGFSEDFSVPGTGCRLQWVSLVTEPGERRAPVVAVYDDLVISAAAPSPP